MSSLKRYRKTTFQKHLSSRTGKNRKTLQWKHENKEQILIGKRYLTYSRTFFVLIALYE